MRRPDRAARCGRGRGDGSVHRVRRGLEPALPGHREALGERLGGVRAVPAFDPEIREVVCSTNAIESVNARIRRAVKARGHFPNEHAALKCVYMAIMSVDPTGHGRRRWTMPWRPALNAFDLAFDGRLTAGRE
ncbi:transposase [Pseudonocardia sp. S2-4]|uniref:Mutator family transposase n=1 Tax=Pseudonocardia humida TaxID=2800819 RepID=A0ABT1A9X7_9PSEU|nr:transposase [Pseudonocardia humida]